MTRALRTGKMPGRKCKSGLALVAVLWIVLALGLIVAGLSATVRAEVSVVGDARQRVEAMALGDAAIHLVLQEMASDAEIRKEMRHAEKEFSGSAIGVDITPLTGLVNLNLAQEALLQRLFEGAGGLPKARADELAQEVMLFREQRTENGALWRFESEEDLLQVPGVDFTLYASIAPLVTAGTLRGGAGVDVDSASREVLMLLTGGDGNLADSIIASRGDGQTGADTLGLDTSLIAGNAVPNTFRLTATVLLPDGMQAKVSRTVAFGSGPGWDLPWKTIRTESLVTSSSES